MKPSLFAHPFASYCQKVLIALCENGTDFIYRRIGPEDPTAMSELTALWPLKKFPVLPAGVRRTAIRPSRQSRVDLADPKRRAVVDRADDGVSAWWRGSRECRCWRRPKPPLPMQAKDSSAHSH